MAKIEKLEIPTKVNFNKIELDRHIRTLFTKVNEIIDVINDDDDNVIDIDDDDDEDED